MGLYVDTLTNLGSEHLGDCRASLCFRPVRSIALFYQRLCEWICRQIIQTLWKTNEDLSQHSPTMLT